MPTRSCDALPNLEGDVQHRTAIAANTAIYSLMDAILVKTVPVQDPGPKWFLRAFLSALVPKSDTPYLHKNLKLLNARSSAFGPARAIPYRQ